MRNITRLLFVLLLTWPLFTHAEDEAEEEATADTEAVEQADAEQQDEEQAADNVVIELPRVKPQPEARRHASLIEHLTLHQRQREVVQMLARETPFNGLFLQETTGAPQGGILLLHDNEQHGHWPTITGPLREYLPDYGWATLAIELPSQPQEILPTRGIYEVVASENSEETDSDDSKEESATEPEEDAVIAEESDSTGVAASGNPEPSEEQQDENFNPNAEPALPRLTGLPQLPDNTQATPEQAAEDAASMQELYQQQMMARIETAISYLNQRGQYNLVIIANGSSASWAVDHLLNRQKQLQAESKEIAGNTLVLIDPLQDRYNQLYLENQLQQLEIPVLDLITDQGITQHSDNKRRAGMMKHKQRKMYRQIPVSAPDLHSTNHHALKRRVRGWLKTNAAGTELPTS